MISEKLIKDCIAYDKAEYNENKSFDQVKAELEAIESTGCLIENIMNCSSCPKFVNECPLK